MSGKIIDLSGQKFGKLTVLERDSSKIGKGVYWFCQCECGNVKSIHGSSLRKGVTKSCGQCSSLVLTNQHFGRWTVIEKDLEKTFLRNKAYWLCKCECGTMKSVSGTSLLNGTSKSCGCLRKEQTSKRRLKDLTNKTFGKLTVIERDFSKKGHFVYWLCKCECGNIVSVRGNDLKNGKTNSCGCLISLGELKIEELLKKMNIDYEKQYTFPELKGENTYGRLLRFDFAIFKNNTLFCLLEYQGELHYNSYEYFGGEEKFLKQKNYDNKKRKFCKNNNIKLIEIPFWDFENLSIEYLNKKIELESDN